VLARDVDKGTLTLAQSGKVDPSLTGFAGGVWTRNNRFAFTADGKRGAFISVGGYYARPTVLGAFTRDPDTGAIKVDATISARRGPKAAMDSCRLALDPVNGRIFAVGESISSHLMPGRN
jgi:hypothetical protein